jgi:putative transposase
MKPEQGVKPILEIQYFPASYYLEKKLENNGNRRFCPRNDPDQLKRIRELEKENKIHIEVRNDNDSRFSQNDSEFS